MAWPCPHWPQTVFFGGDAGEEQCSWGPPDSRARSPTGRSQGSGKRHGDVEEYPSADRDRFFIGKKAPFLHYFLGPSDVRWQTLPTLKREDPIFTRTSSRNASAWRNSRGIWIRSACLACTSSLARFPIRILGRPSSRRSNVKRIKDIFKGTELLSSFYRGP